MPQASDELRAKFDNDYEAWKLLGNYWDDRGMIRPIEEQRIPTKEEGDAIDYLCDEWDYGWGG